MKKLISLGPAAVFGFALLGWLLVVWGDPPQVEFADTSTSSGESSAATAGQFPALFVNWPKPQLALVMTGRQHGYIEPCGCTGLENQMGGLNRRHTFIQQLRRDGWPVVALDVGNQVRRFGRQAELKFQTTIDILRLMQYEGIGLGPDDLHLSFGELIAAVAASDGGDSEFVCANVDLLEMNASHRIVNAAGLKIGITAVLGSQQLRGLDSDEMTTTPPLAALNDLWPTLQRAQCDYYVLLAHTSLEETRVIARKFPQFHFIVSAGGAGEPPLEPETVGGSSARIVQVGTKGKYAAVIGLYPDRTPSLRYQRVPLDARFPDSRPVMDAFGAYQQQLKDSAWRD